MPNTVTDPALRRRINQIQSALSERLERIDPHHRLVGRPVNYRVVSGQTLEITFSDVPRIDESEVMDVKRLVGGDCYCRVLPGTAETLVVRFVVPLFGRER